MSQKKPNIMQELSTDRESIERRLAPIVQAQPSREYKDGIFRMLFSEKPAFLELYNAMNGTDYDNPDDLIVTTLGNAIFISMKNDVSFLVYDRLPLYEHQSTKNRNMPLRDLFYVSSVLSALTVDDDLYGDTLVNIPEPTFVVFYNGVDDAPERQELLLSSAYYTKSENPALELRVTVYNINKGFNRDLMTRCRTLNDYMSFVALVREYNKSMSLAEAMSLAVDECIKNDVLADFLKKNKAEVIKMGICEYDEEKHNRTLLKEGRNRVNALNKRLAADGRTDDIIRSANNEAYQDQLFAEYQI